MDIPHIIRAIQFLVPGSLSELIQHLGRAGRAGQAAVVVLFVEPSVFKKVKKRGRKTGTKPINHESPPPPATKKRALNGTNAIEDKSIEDAEGDAMSGNMSSGTSSETSSEGTTEDIIKKVGLQEC